MSQKPSLKGLHVQDMPLEQAVVINKSQKLAEVIRVMQKQSIDRVLIVANGRPMGIITVKDITFKLSSKSIRKKSPSSLAAAGLASETVISAEENETLLEAALRLESKGISSLLVLNREGTVQGFLTRSRIIGLLKEKYNVPVSKVAEPPTATVSSSAKLSQILARVRDRSAKSLLVLENLRPVGLISEREIAFTLFNLLSTDSIKHTESILDRMLVYDVMIRIRSKLEPDTPLREAIDIMQNDGVLSLALVEDRKVLGLLTRDNIFTYLVGRERS